jgi:glutamyl-Q tRNA(Asp) synthetase
LSELGRTLSQQDRFDAQYAAKTLMPIQTPSQPVFRFAPSPNGRLHLGHAYSALLNEKMAQATSGRLLLRIEDVDRQRSRPEFEAAILEDLDWLGIAIEKPARRQSDHLVDYDEALQRLIDQGFAYRSTISRSAIAALALANPDWPRDPDGSPHPPGVQNETKFLAAEPYAIRLNLARAIEDLGPVVSWRENGVPQEFDVAHWGDVILKTRDGSFSYHLAVTVDDALQGITHIVRGRDLFAATAIHCVLQSLLGLPQPDYSHHDLILDQAGEKLAKSRNSPTLKDLRALGQSPEAVRSKLGFSASVPIPVSR